LYNTEGWFFLVVQIRCCADHGVKQDHKNRPQRGHEEEYLGMLRTFLCSIFTAGANRIEHEQGGQAQGGIELRRWEIL
jgi:hypothetical protein